MLQWEFTINANYAVKASNIFKMFNGTFGHVPVVQRLQIYFCD